MASPAPPPAFRTNRESAIWNLGFRPFYLLAAALGAMSVPLWAAQFSGLLPLPYLRGATWHAHELLFGYTAAVLAGFLLTAVRAWTGQPTATGRPLMALAGLWLAGRVLVMTPFATAAMVVNAAFPLALALAIGLPLWRSRNVRNYFFVALLCLLALFAAGAHLLPVAGSALTAHLRIRLALDLVLFIMVVMGGRVIPMFTNNGVPGTNATRNATLERLALGSTIGVLLGDLAQLPPPYLGVLLAASALAHGARLALWKPWRTGANPLVWILHAAYAWIVLHLALRALEAAGLPVGAAATHALTIGGIGGLTLGMMTRTARGHTGRTLHADNGETAMYLLVQASALVRVAGALAVPAAYLASVQVAALLWSGACALYVARYWPVLTRPRIDGKPG